MILDTSHFYIQNTGKAWSYQASEGVTRFEVRGGDHWSGDAGADKERAEIAETTTFQIGQAYHIDFNVMVEAGAKNTAAWLTLAQIQSTFDAGEAGHSPPFAIEMVGERMRIVTRSSSAAISSNADTTYVNQWTDSTDIVRGHEYHFSIDVKFDAFGKGYLQVSRDDVPLVNYSGALGFNDIVGGYWKEGIYRQGASETIAADYSGLSITSASGPTANALTANVSNNIVTTVLDGGIGKLLAGGLAADSLSGGAGGDILRGGGGRDILDGGAGLDTADYGDKTLGVKIELTPGGDTVAYVGGVAEDTLRNIENLTGGAGADTLAGNGLANVILGGDGDDRLRGGLGADTLDGGAGSDTADYSDKTAAISVSLNGAADAVVKVGGLAEDILRNVENLTGGAGSDSLVGDAKDNSFAGGAGDDFMRGGGGHDVLDGGAGVDTADYQDKSQSVAVSLNINNAVTVYVGGVAEDTLSNVENVNGGSAGDTLTGDTKDNTFYGYGGADSLSGGLGKDLLVGGDGADSLNGGDGADALVGGAGADLLTGGTGVDTFRFLALSDSTPAAMDRITDYVAGEVIDLSALDANSQLAGDQAFKLVSSFSHAAGQLMLSYADGVTTVLADVNGDAAADFAFQINGKLASTSGWIL